MVIDCNKLIDIQTSREPTRANRVRPSETENRQEDLKIRVDTSLGLAGKRVALKTNKIVRCT